MTNDSLLLPDDALFAELDRKSVTGAWTKFVAGQHSALHKVRDEIAQSWQRSAAFGLSARG